MNTKQLTVLSLLILKCKPNYDTVLYLEFFHLPQVELTLISHLLLADLVSQLSIGSSQHPASNVIFLHERIC